MASRPSSVSLRLSLAIAALLAAGVAAALLATARPAHAATVNCPATFRVLHDDRIGSLSLPAGNYTVRATNVTCASTTSLFAQFLQDWDGRLPGGWKASAQGVGRGTFTGPGGQSFAVAKAGSAPVGPLVCSTRLVLTQNDRIGALTLNKGRYLIDRLGPLSPTCGQAIGLVQSFLADFDGRLPNGWLLLPGDATFVRGSVSYGFRLEPDPDHGGGNRYPTKTTRCPATFRVVNSDHVGALRFPAGPYWVSIYKGTGITCPQSSQLFAAFLQRTNGSLPSPWVIDTATGSFRRGKGSPYGFVAKPAFDAAR